MHILEYSNSFKISYLIISKEISYPVISKEHQVKP